MPLRSLIGSMLKKKKKKISGRGLTKPGQVDDNARERDRRRREKQKKILEQLSSRGERHGSDIASKLGKGYDHKQRIKHQVKSAYKKVGL